MMQCKQYRMGFYRCCFSNNKTCFFSKTQKTG